MPHRPPHPRHGAVLAAVAARMAKHPNENAAEAALRAVLMDLLIDRLDDARKKIPTTTLPLQVQAAVIAFIDDTAEHIAASESYVLAAMVDIPKVIAYLENEAEE